MSKYFYCYNKAVSDFLNSKGIKYITVAINPMDKRMYSMYEKTSHLDMALKEYKSHKL